MEMTPYAKKIKKLRGEIETRLRYSIRSPETMVYAVNNIEDMVVGYLSDDSQESLFGPRRQA